MLNMKTASHIAGYTDYRTDEPSDHEITPSEHDLACEVAHEMADRHGIDLDALVAKQYASEAAYREQMGIK